MLGNRLFSHFQGRCKDICGCVFKIEKGDPSVHDVRKVEDEDTKSKTKAKDFIQPIYISSKTPKEAADIRSLMLHRASRFKDKKIQSENLSDECLSRGMSLPFTKIPDYSMEFSCVHSNLYLTAGFYEQPCSTNYPNPQARIANQNLRIHFLVPHLAKIPMELGIERVPRQKFKKLLHLQ